MWRNRRRLLALAAGAWLVGAAIVWNLRFDRHVHAGTVVYLEQQAAWSRGEGPRPTLRGVMEPAARAGARDATLWAVVVLLAGTGSLAALHRASPSTSSGA